MLEKTLESPLDCKEIKPVNPKRNQSWIFIGRTDAEAEAPILWPPDAKNWLIGKYPDDRIDWKQEEKGTTEDEMVRWHHWFDGHEFDQSPGIGNEQWSLARCSLWDWRVRRDWATELNWTCQPTTTSSSISTTFFAGKMLLHSAGGRKCFVRVCQIPKHRILCYRNKQIHFSLAKNMLIVLVPILINKDVVEPSYKDLKFMVWNCNYVCTNLINFGLVGFWVLRGPRQSRKHGNTEMITVI